MVKDRKRQNANAARWRDANPTSKRRSSWKSHGIKDLDRAEHLWQCINRCEICLKPFTDYRGRGKHIDHNHETGFTRGVLCARCNNGLGLFKDNPVNLRAAARFLENA